MIYHGDILDYILETPEVLERVAASETATFTEAVRLVRTKSVRRIVFLGMGSSYNAAYAAAFSERKKYGFRIQVMYPAAFYGLENVFSKEHTLIVGISQQGTSTEVINGVKYACRCGFRTLAVTGEEKTPLAESADEEVIVPIGPEDAGATTKGYVATVFALMRLAEIFLGKESDVRPMSVADLCAFMREAFSREAEEASFLARKTALAEELILIISDRMSGHLQEITLKFSEMCRIAVRGYTADEFVHGIYNSVTERSVFLFLMCGEPTLTEKRLKAYYRERGYETLYMEQPFLEGWGGLQMMPLLMRLCVMTARMKGIDVNCPADPEFHMKIGSKLEQGCTSAWNTSGKAERNGNE
jgi:fructoselysine-6-P-deglycase FrlB-like protein